MCKYAVVDLEMCRVPYKVRTKEFQIANETIQIGAVLLDEDLEIADEFVTYVEPQYGHIDTYIQNLTGIGKNDITGAPAFDQVLTKFIEWLPDDVKLVSWSNNDELQIRREAEAKNIEVSRFEEIFEGWIDCQRLFGDKLESNRCYKLSEALVAADILYEDGIHDGLIDARNTARLFAKMVREPSLKLNTYYLGALAGEKGGLSFTLGSLFENMELQNIISA